MFASPASTRQSHAVMAASIAASIACHPLEFSPRFAVTLWMCTFTTPTSCKPLTTHRNRTVQARMLDLWSVGPKLPDTASWVSMLWQIDDLPATRSPSSCSVRLPA